MTTRKKVPIMMTTMTVVPRRDDASVDDGEDESDNEDVDDNEERGDDHASGDDEDTDEDNRRSYYQNDASTVKVARSMIAMTVLKMKMNTTILVTVIRPMR